MPDSWNDATIGFQRSASFYSFRPFCSQPQLLEMKSKLKWIHFHFIIKISGLLYFLCLSQYNIHLAQNSNQILIWLGNMSYLCNLPVDISTTSQMSVSYIPAYICNVTHVTFHVGKKMSTQIYVSVIYSNKKLYQI